MPPLPPWEGMHVIVVHFPIALLSVAPLFVLIGALTGLRSMMVSALILMVLGVGGAFVAVNTGEAAMDVMEIDTGDSDKDDVGYEVADLHQEQAEYASQLFAGMTALYAVLLALPLVAKKCGETLPRVAMHLIFLGLWAYPAIQLVNAAHEGGRLVHEFGVRSVLAETAEEEAEADEQEESDRELEEAA